MVDFDDFERFSYGRIIGNSDLFEVTFPLIFSSLRSRQKIVSIHQTYFEELEFFCHIFREMVETSKKPSEIIKIACCCWCSKRVFFDFDFNQYLALLLKCISRFYYCMLMVTRDWYGAAILSRYRWWLFLHHSSLHSIQAWDEMCSFHASSKHIHHFFATLNFLSLS